MDSYIQLNISTALFNYKFSVYLKIICRADSIFMKIFQEPSVLQKFSQLCLLSCIIPQLKSQITKWSTLVYIISRQLLIHKPIVSSNSHLYQLLNFKNFLQQKILENTWCPKLSINFRKLKILKFANFGFLSKLSTGVQMH